MGIALKKTLTRTKFTLVLLLTSIILRNSKFTIMSVVLNLLLSCYVLRIQELLVMAMMHNQKIYTTQAMANPSSVIILIQMTKMIT